MMDDLQQAYNAYQQALVFLQDRKVGDSFPRPMVRMLNQICPKEPRLWYGIGILYDRYGSLELAEEAFAHVMRMQPDFDKAHEIYFRLGIIYKQQGKHVQSLEVRLRMLRPRARNLTCPLLVLQVHSQLAPDAAHRGGHLVPDRSCT